MPSAFQLGNDSDLHAYAFVPNGTLRLGHRAEFSGKIVAKDAVVGFDNEAEGLQLALITMQPSDAEVRETDVAEFSVEVTGEGLSYQWRKNGMDFPDATGPMYTTPPTVFDTDDGARFSVVIANAAGSVTSDEATLTVIPCASEISFATASTRTATGRRTRKPTSTTATHARSTAVIPWRVNSTNQYLGARTSRRWSPRRLQVFRPCLEEVSTRIRPSMPLGDSCSMPP
jgi:hypothetical protein